jgi:hypothetical protein
MSDNTEEKIPTKEEIISLMKEQIEVKEYQLKLQELNEKLAKARAGELQALQFMATLTNPQAGPEAEEHTVTQEDLDNNPELAIQGFKVGDEVLVPKQERKLKK